MASAIAQHDKTHIVILNGAKRSACGELAEPLALSEAEVKNLCFFLGYLFLRTQMLHYSSSMTNNKIVILNGAQRSEESVFFDRILHSVSVSIEYLCFQYMSWDISYLTA